MRKPSLPKNHSREEEMGFLRFFDTVPGLERRSWSDRSISMKKDYPIPAGFLERETEVRKSRFIARVVPVNSRDEVKDWLKQAHRDHPDAGHICWAFQVGRPGSATEAAMNDDGEPSGTAGKPILNVKFNTRIWAMYW